MTTEEKLDFLMAKMKAREYVVGRIDKETGREVSHLIFNQIYGKLSPKDEQVYYSAKNEFEQLLDVLQKDGMFQNDVTDDKMYVLTLKGQMFDGYVKQKRLETVKRYAFYLNTGILTAGAIFAIWLAGLQIHETITDTPDNKEIERQVSTLSAEVSQARQELENLSLQVLDLSKQDTSSSVIKRPADK